MAKLKIRAGEIAEKVLTSKVGQGIVYGACVAGMVAGIGSGVAMLDSMSKSRDAQNKSDEILAKVVASQKFKDISQQNGDCIRILENNNIFDDETASTYSGYNGSTDYAYDNRAQFCSPEEAEEWATANNNEKKYTRKMITCAILGGVGCAVGGIGLIAASSKINEIKKRREREELEELFADEEEMEA